MKGIFLNNGGVLESLGTQVSGCGGLGFERFRVEGLGVYHKPSNPLKPRDPKPPKNLNPQTLKTINPQNLSQGGFCPELQSPSDECRPVSSLP